jgi:hypothetical protein
MKGWNWPNFWANLASFSLSVVASRSLMQVCLEILVAAAFLGSFEAKAL